MTKRPMNTISVSMFDDELDTAPVFQKIQKVRRADENFQPAKKKGGNKHVDKRAMYLEV